jgi:ABC-2 type transport system ATP-binding protein
MTSTSIGTGTRRIVRVPLGLHRRAMVPAVVAHDLSKSFGPIQAVRGVSFEVAGGEIFAFLGPDDAGKSTIIRMLCTLTEPTGGRAAVAGYDIAQRPRAVRRRAALVSEDRALEILRALPSTRDVLFVDEPRSGFDLRTRAGLWHDLRRLRDEGTTVIFTTSSVNEAEQADRIAIIDAGRIVALDTPAGLRATAGGDDVFRHFAGYPIRPARGDELGAARRFIAARRPQVALEEAL